MKEEQKNLLLAMGLSLAVIVGWQYFFVPKPAQRPAQTQTQPVTPAESPAVTGKPATTPATPGQPAATAGAPPAPGAATPGTAPVAPGVAVPPGARALAAPRDRKAALADSPRIAIDSPALIGSIALKGGRIDDIRLKNYKVSIKPDSDIITLMSPPGAPEPYYSETGFVSPDTSLALPRPDTLWTSNDRQLAPGKPVTLTWDNGKGLTFKRVISVDEHYLFTVADSIENKSAAPVTVHPYALLHRIGRPKTEGFYVLHEGLVGIIGDSKVQEITYDSIFKEKNNARVMKGTSGWIGITDKYWATALIPDQKVEFDGRFWGAPGTGTTAAPLTPATYQTDVLEAARTLAPGASSTATHLIFAGAKESQQIDAYQAKYNIKNFDLMIDWGWFYFITKPLFFVIDFLYKYLGNFGFAILMATVLIKLVFFPLANRSYESMAKMKAVQPEMQALQKRYENDKQKMQQELMALYKREKINPIAGCWPILIQIPVFFALYKVIFITIEMRHAPFVGWIRDLSAQDPTNLFNLFGALPFDPAQAPVIGPFLHMGVWPILMGITMFLQMKMNPEPTDPVQKAMFAWMPLIFTFMLASFPAGLVIYWTWNNILSVAQQYFIMRKQGVKVELWDNLMGMFRKKAA